MSKEFNEWLEQAKKEMQEEGSEETWEPEEAGDILSGIFLKAEVTAPGQYGKGLLIFVKEDGTGITKKSWANRTVYRRELAKSMPKRGSFVAVLYEGYQEPEKEGGNKFHAYKVKAQHSDPAYWDTIFADYHNKPAHQKIVTAAGEQDPLEDPF